ncbi:microfibrillar-associated protein 1 [Culicoides brevitarsis]|uniref:microfibrillar-associated protein 1 n=1 Tax=Culicoides brevitarsis TaxID=469753 RepID=UPI00307C6128
MNQASSVFGIQSTAGAVPVKNEKGEISMKKVKVSRYISGKRPEYAQYESSDEESTEDDFLHTNRNRIEDIDTQVSNLEPAGEDDYSDPRLKRLIECTKYDGNEKRRYRTVHEPEVLQESDELSNSSEQQNHRTRRISLEQSETDSNEDLSDSEIERRRQKLREKALQKKQDEELLAKEEEKQSDISDLDSSEYETDDESEGENEPRLKPLFVRKRDRATVIEKEREIDQQKQQEYEARRLLKERRRQTLRLVEESVKKELEQLKAEKEPNIGDVNTDDENDEIEYEAWKLRELKRIKRDREEKEQLEKEKVDIERLRNMTEEERRQELRLNPKLITNKAVKGKYKFLQKYYHRGAFYLENEDNVLKQDFSAPTLEDHFDKTILPKVMQVKNFGRCGRTKYTHLVDQDTTKFDSPWFTDSTANVKFHTERAGGMKQVFDRPSAYKRKNNQ